MSRRGGKRKHIVQLGSTSSKLHRYGYSKQLHSGEVPKLIGDYPDSESEEEEDQAIDGQNGDASDDVMGKEEPNAEKQPAPGDMDDELRNFLSEIEAIPMPPDGEKDNPPTTQEGSPADTPQSKSGEEDNKDSEPASRADPEPELANLPASKPNQYSMFVKGGTEFVPSPSQLPPGDDGDASASGGEKGALEDLPEEPVTPWQMVQDEATQYYYYWNYITNEVTWEIPVEYSQYLLLHKEYLDKISKFTPEQLKALQEKKARDSSKITSHQPSAPSWDALRTQQLHSTDHSTTKTEESHRHRHKKKKKKHKRKYSDDDSSGEERSSRIDKKKEIGPEPKPPSPKPKPPSPKPSSVTTSGSLLSIVPYASDQEDEDEDEDQKDKETEPTTSVPSVTVEGDAESENKTVEATSSEVHMPDLSAPVTPQLSPQTMPDLSPAMTPATVADPATPVGSPPQVLPESPGIPSIKQEDIKLEMDGSGSGSEVPIGSESKDAIVSKDLGVEGADGDISHRTEGVEIKEEVVPKTEVDEISVKLEQVQSVNEMVREVKQESVGEEEIKKVVKPKKKKKEILDMFAEEFPPLAENQEVKSIDGSALVDGSASIDGTTLMDKTISDTKKSVPEPMVAESREEGEIVDTKKPSPESVEVVKNKSATSDHAIKVIPSVENHKSSKLQEKGVKAATSLVASYGTEEEDEEGEVKEKIKPKKKKKDKKKDSKKKKSDEKTSKEPSSAESKSTEGEVKAATFLVPSAEALTSKEPERLEVVTEVTEDTSMDIDPEDLDDIDRALERALERKMVELDSISKDDTPKEGSPAPAGTEQTLQNGQQSDNVPENEETMKTQVSESEVVKAEVRDMAELALSKLEFLDINTDNLSRLQVLFIELQTRLSDWTSGGLSTTYFLQQLQVAEGLLEQYETSAVPEGWACQWDRYDLTRFLLVFDTLPSYYTPRTVPHVWTRL